MTTKARILASLLACLCLLLGPRAFSEDYLDQKTKDSLKQMGSNYIKQAPKSIQQGNALVKAKYIMTKYCDYLAAKNITANCDIVDRASKGETYTCGDMKERVKSLFAGASIKGVMDVFCKNDGLLWKAAPNRNHTAPALLYNGKIYIFDPWAHAYKHKKSFANMGSGIFNGISTHDWYKQMTGVGYIEFSFDGERWDDILNPSLILSPKAQSGTAAKPSTPAVKKPSASMWVLVDRKTYKSQEYNMADYSKQSGSASDSSLSSREEWTLGELTGQHACQMDYKFDKDMSSLLPGSNLVVSATISDSTGQGEVGGWICFQGAGTGWNMWDGNYKCMVEFNGASKQTKGSTKVPPGSKEGAKILLRARITAGRSSITYDRVYEWRPPGAPSSKAPSSTASPSSSTPTFIGKWNSDWGVIEFKKDGNKIVGSYPYKNGKLSGELQSGGTKFIGKWMQGPSYAPPDDAGAIEFTLAPGGKSFTGIWWYGTKPKDGSGARSWNGTRAN